ncbi:MAG TPA: tetratricopeptide repeat protein [Vicinamibacterales bacterium]|nr:tetratricopeptide repeat protein [Vicinamibacterales bacterium]
MLAALAVVASLAAGPVTFTRDVAPLIARHCGECHRAGGAAPFSLTTYAEVRRRATLIVDATRRRYMPPWMPDPAGHASAAFQGMRRLSDDEIGLIGRWAQDGFIEGSALDLPRPRPMAPSGAWTLGVPDLIVAAEPFALAAEGGDVFRTFVAKVPETQVRYVRAFEFRAGAGGAVHHANIKIDRTDSSRALDRAEAGPGYEGAGGRGALFPDGHFLGWTPGQSPRVTPDGLVWTLPPGADVVFELHMVPTGRTEAVQASIGLYFADQPPTRLPVMIRLGRQDIDIPAGRNDYVSEDSYVLPAAATVLALQPHAHRLATRMRGWATLPDGTTRPLISIPRWNVSWQDTYVLRDPLRLPAGSRLSMSFTYDNSSDNPGNVSPPRRVTFGQSTRFEMGDLWVQVMPDSEDERPRLFTDVAKVMLRADISGVETMLQVGPDDARLRTDLAFCYVEAGRLPEAVEQLRRATRLAPESAPTHHDLATLLLRQHLYDEARRELETVIHLQPDLFEAYVNLGVADFAQGRTASAIAWYERSLLIAADNATAHYDLAVAYDTLGNLVKARLHYERAATLEPGDVESQLGLARLLVRQGEAGAAAARYRQVVALAPRNAGALLDLAWILSTTSAVPAQAPHEAIDLAERALGLPEVDRPTALDVLAAAYAADGQVDQAIATARQALALVVSAGGAAELRDGIARRLASYERRRVTPPPR